jgi:Family of unknown function (DUF6600)
MNIFNSGPAGGRTTRRVLAALVALVLPLPLPLHAQSATNSDVGDPPARVARLSVVSGAVSFQASGVSDWSLATPNSSLTTGDRLFTGSGARAELEVGSFSVRMADSTDLMLADLEDRVAQFGIAQGTVRLTVYRLAPGDTIEVDTPNAAFTIRSPGTYRIEIPRDADYTLLTVDEGSATASGPGVDMDVTTAQTASFAGYNPVQASAVAGPPPTPFDTWSAQRDLRATGASCARYMSPDIPGCADLDQYGHWQQTAAYGVVWYPTPGIPAWTPYRYGHWVWVEPWGWVWVDDAPWGFAPFHYGRWALIDGAWAWVPGPVLVAPYYSPALVVFVSGPRFGVGIQAWFPLGPRDPYIPWYHYGPRYLHAVNAANVRGVKDFDAFVRGARSPDFRWAHRDDGFTATSSDAFRNGRPVDRAIVKVRPADIGAARVAPHPTVVPGRPAAVGGPPLSRPPATARRPMVSRPAPEPKPPARGAPPTGARPRTATPRPIVTRRPAPAPLPPFTIREKAMHGTPGRPLDPKQIDNLRKGKPAGPPHNSGRSSQPARGGKQPPKRGSGGGG